MCEIRCGCSSIIHPSSKWRPPSQPSCVSLLPPVPPFFHLEFFAWRSMLARQVSSDPHRGGCLFSRADAHSSSIVFRISATIPAFLSFAPSSSPPVVLRVAFDARQSGLSDTARSGSGTVLFRPCPLLIQKEYMKMSGCKMN